MRLLLTALLALIALPAAAQLQFEPRSNTQPAQTLGQPNLQQLTPGIMWLQRTPASLFDLGMMEMTAAANKSASAVFDITGAVAEYQADKGLVALSFYARTAYSELNCELVITKIRDTMFPKRDDATQLADDLGSYFSTYGGSMAGRPSSIGSELVAIMRFAVFMPGGACQMPLYGSDTVSYWKDPNAPPPQAPAAPAAAPAIPPAVPLTKR